MSSRQDAIYFIPPAVEKDSHNSSSIHVKKKKTSKSLLINVSNCKYEIVKKCAHDYGFKITQDPKKWFLFWIDTGVSIERILDMAPYQKINHFPGMQEICRKNHLARNLSKLSRAFPSHYDFFPKTWILPMEWSDFKLAYRPQKRQYYIVKPDHGCQGKGIYLCKSPKQIENIQKKSKNTEDIVVQKYITRPCLIDGYKFDLRIYVLVTSVDPLRVFLYKDGLARFATELYAEPSGKNASNLFTHLTNYAINKNSENFIHDDDENGSKRSLKSVFNTLREEYGVNIDLLWSSIEDVIIKTIIVVQSQISNILTACFPKSSKTLSNSSNSSTRPSSRSSDKPAFTGSQCFEILGFDILLDHKFKPIVLEVNHSPSFSCDSELDTKIKSGVIGDALQLLNLNVSHQTKFEKLQKMKSKTRLWKSASSISMEKKKQELHNSNSTIFPPLASPSVSMNTRQIKSSGTKSHTRQVKLQNSREKDESSMNSNKQVRYLSTPPPASSSSIKKDEQDEQDLQDLELQLEINELKERHGGSARLCKLTMYEDAHLGNYKRIFPPDNDPEKLSTYLVLLAKTKAIFGFETASYKARREFLSSKKQAQLNRFEKFEEWKKNRKSSDSYKTIYSKPLVPNGITTHFDTATATTTASTSNITHLKTQKSLIKIKKPPLAPSCSLLASKESYSSPTNPSTTSTTSKKIIKSARSTPLLKPIKPIKSIKPMKKKEIINLSIQDMNHSFESIFLP